MNATVSVQITPHRTHTRELSRFVRHMWLHVGSKGWRFSVSRKVISSWVVSLLIVPPTLFPPISSSSTTTPTPLESDTQTPLNRHTHQKGSSTCLLLFMYLTVFLLSLSLLGSLSFFFFCLSPFISFFLCSMTITKIARLVGSLCTHGSDQPSVPECVGLGPFVCWHFVCLGILVHLQITLHHTHACAHVLVACHTSHKFIQCTCTEMFEPFCVISFVHHVTSGCSWNSLPPSYLFFVFHDTDTTDWKQTEPVRDSALVWTVWPIRVQKCISLETWSSTTCTRPWCKPGGRILSHSDGHDSVRETCRATRTRDGTRGPNPVQHRRA